MLIVRNLGHGLANLRLGRPARALITLMVLGLALLVAAACGTVTAPGGSLEAPRVPSSPNAVSAHEGESAPAKAAGGAAAKGELVGQFFCYAETLTADRPSAYGYLAARGCQPSGAFKRGERMVFRFQILDIGNGTILTSDEAAGVQVRLPFIGDMDADFKQRGEGRVADAPWTWDFCWDVPLDYPLGTVDSSVVLRAKDGRSSVWKPPALVDPSRGIDTRPQIFE